MHARRAASWLLALALLLWAPAFAQNLPQLTGRVVDQANLLSPAQEQEIVGKLAALERATTRQVVVVTVPDLQGYSVEDFAFRLGEQWKLGNREADNGAILLVAVADKRIRIEVGDGIEGILPDAMAYFIIRDRMTPRFKEQDYAGGIAAGVDGMVEQLQAPLEVAEQRALQAGERRRQEQQERSRGNGDGSMIPMIIWGLVIVFIILPALFGRAGRGRTYRRRRGWGMGGPVIIWGGGSGGGWGGGGGGWGGGGGFGGGGGGFSGGGGSFGGGGASGSW